MLVYSRKLGRNYALELAGLYMIRSFLDGITFWETEVNADFYEGDHKPCFSIRWVFFNFIIFEFQVYNIHHKKREL